MISKETFDDYIHKCKQVHNIDKDRYGFCFHCSKVIRDSEPSFAIMSRTGKERYLYFHMDCFIEIAGLDYMIEPEL